MTREERDKLQAAIDELPELEKRVSAEEKVAPRHVEIGGKKLKLVRTNKASLLRAHRFSLALCVEPLIPNVTVDDGAGGDLNLTALLGPIMQLFAKKKVPGACKGAIFPVVDGHEEHDSENMSEDALEIWQADYCLKVPGDLLNEALTAKTSRWMGGLAHAHIAKKNTP